MEKFIATALLAAFVAVWGIHAERPGPLGAALEQIAAGPLMWMQDAPDAPEPAQAPVADIAADSIPKGKKSVHSQKIVQEEDGRRVELELQDGEISRLNIDGKEVPPAEYNQHLALTESLRREVLTPMPPMAPIPGMPPMPAMAPMAPMPGMPPMPAMAPMAPMDSWSGSASQITTEKDADGNTVIHLVQPGQGTAIVLKNGEVWIDGKKVEPGQTYEVPAGASVMSWGGNDEFKVFAPAPDAFAFYPSKISSGNFSPEDMARWEAENAESLKKQQREMEEEWKRQEKEWKKQQKNWSKEQRRQMEQMRRDMERAQADMRRAERDMNLRHQRAQAEAAYAHAQGVRAHSDARQSNNVGQAFKTELLRDGLITDPRNYSLQLNHRELIVNGKKQSDDLHRKYLELYAAKTGQPLGTSGNISINENSN